MADMKVTSVEEFIAEAREYRAEEEYLAREYEPSEHVQLNRLSITHEAIMDWLLTNPGKGQMKKCADHFGFTQAWLSSIVWSDAFQAKLRDKKEFLFGQTVVSIRDQVNGVAQRALERLGEKIEYTEDVKVLTDVSDKLLHRLGYAPKVDQNPGVQNNIQNNYFPVSPALLAQARENSKKGDLQHESSHALPAPERVQNDEEGAVGEAFNFPSTVRVEGEEST